MEKPRGLYIGMMINPGGALRDAFPGKWCLSAALSALAFGMFFADGA